MTPFKFRAVLSNGEQNRMIYSHVKEDHHYFSMNSHPSGLMQSTGLFDQHGQEVYELDIVCIGNINFLVTWEYLHARFVLERDKKIHSEFRSLIQSGRIIGNLPQHPHLV